MNVFWNIAPIFVVILIGYLGRRWGLIPLGFVGPANRVVFYIGIPSLLLKAIMGAPLREILNPSLLACFVISPPLVWLFALAFLHWGRISKGRARGSFLQGAVHGNLGYVGLAVTLYVLGEEGIRLAGVVIGFLIITQNVLGVLSLTLYSEEASRKGVSVSLITNPIIIACFSGLLISCLGLPVPEPAARTLHILGGMALPTALLIIGANLSLPQIRGEIGAIVSLAALKLFLLPLVGLALANLFLHPSPLEKGVIISLLGAPTATVTSIMAGEMGGDAGLASGAVTFTLLLSMLTYTFWFTWHIPPSP